MSVWSLFAFKEDEDSLDDERRELAEWQIEDAVRWARHRGYDTILLERDKEKVAEYRQPRPSTVEHVEHSSDWTF